MPHIVDVDESVIKDNEMHDRVQLRFAHDRVQTCFNY